jgi:hypothetical protein
MRSPAMLRSVFGLATAFTLLTLAGTKQLQLTEVLAGSQWQCNPSLLVKAFRVLIWMFSDQGRAIIAATIAATAVLSWLYRHSLPEARELAIVIVMLLAFLSFIVIQGEASIDTRNCIQSKANLVNRS